MVNIRVFFFVFLSITSYTLSAQILPKEGSTLNYRLMGFSFPKAQQANKYTVEIAVGNHRREDSFKAHIILSLHPAENKVIATVPFFGKEYTWRVIYAIGPSVRNSELHHFATGIIPEADTAVTRLRVLKSAVKYKDAYVFLDGHRALYDMNGQPVWYLPDVDGTKIENKPKPEDVLLRDLKISSQGTITFLLEEIGAYEINYNGTVLWKGPNNGKVSGGNSELYHHQLTRLANGHYMVLGSEFEAWDQKSPSIQGDDNHIMPTSKVKRDSVRYFQKIIFGTLIEYDESGKVVWSWKAADYFRKSDLYFHTRHGRPELSAHENAFYFDERTQSIYLSFRNISRIIKLKYPEGNIIRTYGTIYKPGDPEQNNGMYCHQHSCGRSSQGYLYLYNNNSCDFNHLPKLMMFEEPVSDNDTLKKIWEYQCTTEGADTVGQEGQYQFPVGGNVIELPDRSLFAVMSTTYSKVFIVNMNKELLWSAIPEKWNAATKKWVMTYQYRASIITNTKDLERLIWNAEKK